MAGGEGVDFVDELASLLERVRLRKICCAFRVAVEIPFGMTFLYVRALIVFFCRGGIFQGRRIKALPAVFPPYVQRLLAVHLWSRGPQRSGTR